MRQTPGHTAVQTATITFQLHELPEEADIALERCKVDLTYQTLHDASVPAKFGMMCVPIAGRLNMSAQRTFLVLLLPNV